MPHRRVRDRALVLLILGAVLLMPPGAQIFQIEAKIGGIPVGLAVLFLIWAGLILGARASAAALTAKPSAEDTPP